MTDEHVPEYALDPEGLDEAAAERAFDEQRFDGLSAALTAVPFLDPRIDPRIEPSLESNDDPIDQPVDQMPDWAWTRLLAAIDAEAATRAVADHDNVVAFPPAPPASGGTEERRPSRLLKWGGGLVAASAVVLVGAVGVNVLNSSSTNPPVVTANAPIASAVAASLTAGGAPAQPLAAQAEDAPDVATEFSPSPSSADAFAAEPAPSPSFTPGFKAAGPTVVQAARMVTKSDTNYQAEQLPDQVRSLLSDVGVDSPADASAMPTVTALPVTDGFTRNWQELRNCITWLTHHPQSQALVVDRGSFEGDPAGVVVAPAQADADPNTPTPTTTITTDSGLVDVWVVRPDCKDPIDDKMENLAPFAPAP